MQRVTLGAMIACSLLMGCLEPARLAPEPHPAKSVNIAFMMPAAGESVCKDGYVWENPSER